MNAGINVLSWSQRPFREILRLATPMAVSMISYALMALVSTLLAGRLGVKELTAVGSGSLSAFILICFPMGILRGAKTLISQCMGAQQESEVGKYIGASLVVAGISGIFALLLGPVVAHFLSMYAEKKEVGNLSSQYLLIRTVEVPFYLLYVALREIRYGQSDARSPMIATIIAYVVNTVLALFFTYNLHWGVAGLAWATVIAHSVEALVLLCIQIVRQGFPVRGMQVAHIKALLKVGVPVGIQSTLEVGSFSLAASMIYVWSYVEYAAHSVAMQILHLSFLPAFAVAEAASVLAGQAVGANQDQWVVKIARRSALVTLAYNGLFTLLLVLFATQLLQPFLPTAKATKVVSETQNLIVISVRLLHIAAVFQVFDGLNMVARATLRGSGDVRIPALIGLATSWLLTPPLTWLLGRMFGLGAAGAWIGLCFEIILGAALLWYRLEKGRWRKMAAASRKDNLSLANGKNTK